jgi:hypothetical protein
MAARFPITAIFRGQFDRLVAGARRAFGQIGREGSRLRRAGKAAGQAAGSVAVGVAAAMGASLRRVIAFEDSLDAIRVQAGATESQTAGLRNQINATSKATGISREEIAGAVDALVNLQGASAAIGDVGIKNISLMGRAAKATGASGEDLAGVMFALKNAFDISSPEEMERALSAVTAIGKDASVPLSQLGGVLQKVAVKFKNVSAGGVAGAADLTAALQIAREAFGSPEETATGLKATITALLGQSREFKKFGVQVFDVGKNGERSLKPLREILDQIGESDLATRPDLLKKALGSAEALDFTNALIGNRQAWDDMAVSALESTSIQTDFLARAGSQAGQVQIALNELKLAQDEAFTPERLAGYIEGLKAGVDLLVKTINFFSDVGESIGDLGAFVVERGIQRDLKKNQLIAEQLGTERGTVPKRLQRQLKREGFRGEELRNEAARRQVRQAEREGLIQDGAVQASRVGQIIGKGPLDPATLAAITNLQLAQERVAAARSQPAALSRPRAEAAAAEFAQAGQFPAAAQPTQFGQGQGALLQLSRSQERIAESLEKNTASLGRVIGIVDRAGAR